MKSFGASIKGLKALGKSLLVVLLVAMTLRPLIVSLSDSSVHPVTQAALQQSHLRFCPGTQDLRYAPASSTFHKVDKEAVGGTVLVPRYSKEPISFHSGPMERLAENSPAFSPTFSPVLRI